MDEDIVIISPSSSNIEKNRDHLHSPIHFPPSPHSHQNIKLPLELDFDSSENIDNKTASVLKSFSPFPVLSNNNNNINSNNQKNQSQYHLQQTTGVVPSISQQQKDQLYQLQKQKQQQYQQQQQLHQIQQQQQIKKQQIQQQSSGNKLYLEEKVAPPAVRVCEFCGCTTTPTWRRGPSGKGSLCNACGIKWRLKGKDSLVKKQGRMPPLPPTTGTSNKPIGSQQQIKPSTSSSQSSKPSSQSSHSHHHHHHHQQQQQHVYMPQQQQSSHHHQPLQQSLSSSSLGGQHNFMPKPHQPPFQQHNLPNLPNYSSYANELSVPNHSPDLYKKKRKLDFSLEPTNTSDLEKGYYCKYCKKTWPQSSFKNSQQFGAHCSNCSRKPRGDIEALMSLKKKFSKKRSKDGLYDDDGAVPLWDTAGRYNRKSMGNHNPLLTRLLNIVESQLIEPTELSNIKEEIDSMKTDLTSRKKRRVEQLSSFKQLVNSEMNEMKVNIDVQIRNSENKKKSFIDDLKREIDMRIHDKESIFSSDSLSHTVPIPRGSQLPALKEPLSPELIHSPPKKPTFYRDEQGNRFPLDMSETTL
ncbi:GATA-binding transcription factor [Heterostelium album PN500]|uniref:GATA-binding transcription factor n=1 Tax=Heterostelium pallidum (strain ATCC 26659 / Pp 5 / PN500) TaxID=670386 RepID=D3BC98_HETP5|nr:GATA-binding transcription factor [Heterostelium album PN500]EFA80888.1 GATA-binding transcription factor [Heterostelium album PN500]|eukprot:XP_020433007.1 GATA-binding transcription factor [Heterostelium album PN500]